MPLEKTLRQRLHDLDHRGLRRRPAELGPLRENVTEIDGKPHTLFCSNDYLGFANDPRIAESLHRASLTHGTGAGASRLVSGSRLPHTSLERELAAWVGAPAALSFSSGYAANVGALSALLDRECVVLSDELNHASLIDGIRLSRAEVVVYPHRDTDTVSAELRRAHRAGRSAWVVTDAVFSMDGDEAPLAALAELCRRYGASLYVDEAHSLGVLGDGRGLCNELDVEPDVLVGTLGKAAGMSGAFVAGSEVLRDYLLNRARSFVFSTAVSPAWAAALRTAVSLVETAHDRRALLFRHCERVRTELQAQGWDVPAGRTPIIPVRVGEPERAMTLSSALSEAGIFIQGIRPPTVPTGQSRLRIVPTASHTDAQIEELLRAFAELRSR